MSSDISFDYRQLLQHGEYKRYSQNQVIYKTGDFIKDVFILLVGSVAIYTSNNEGYPIKLYEVQPGELFGDMPYPQNMRQTMEAKAQKDSIVVFIRPNNLQDILSRYPQLSHRIIHGLVQRSTYQSHQMRNLYNSNSISSICEAENTDEGLHNSKEMSIFLQGHKYYSNHAPSSHREYLFDKDVDCPVCGNAFRVKMVKNSKIRLKKLDEDLRERYVDIEPIWYQIWACPKCYYSNFALEYTNIIAIQKEKLKGLKASFEQEINLSFSDPYHIDEVFNAYYMAVRTLELIKAKPVKLANLWLRLGWLYNDLEDQPMEFEARKKAMEHFKSFYYNGDASLYDWQEQRLALILGDLSYRNGELEESLNLFRKAALIQGGKQEFRRLAKDRIDRIREEKMASS